MADDKKLVYVIRLGGYGSGLFCENLEELIDSIKNMFGMDAEETAWNGDYYSIHPQMMTLEQIKKCNAEEFSGW